MTLSEYADPESDEFEVDERPPLPEGWRILPNMRVGVATHFRPDGSLAYRAAGRHEMLCCHGEVADTIRGRLAKRARGGGAKTKGCGCANTRGLARAPIPATAPPLPESMYVALPRHPCPPDRGGLRAENAVLTPLRALDGGAVWLGKSGDFYCEHGAILRCSHDVERRCPRAEGLARGSAKGKRRGRGRDLAMRTVACCDCVARLPNRVGFPEIPLSAD